MKNEDIVAILDLLGMTLSRILPDILIAGSPERCLERIVVKDSCGHPWVLERLDPATLARKKDIFRPGPCP
jgi:hypothetical protein